MFVYYFILAIWAYDPKSYFGTCNGSIRGLVDTVLLFIAYTAIPFLSAPKETTFAAITSLEYPYPISAFCYSAVFEVKDDMIGRFEIFIRYPEKLPENIMRKLGTIMMNLMTGPDCILSLNGPCAGTKFGTAVNLIFLP